MARPKGTVKRKDTISKSITFDRKTVEEAQELTNKRGMTFTAFVERAVLSEIALYKQNDAKNNTTGESGMWRILITNFSGNIIDKSDFSGADRTISAWEKAWDTYTGQPIIMRLLERSTVKLTHRFDLEADIFGYLPRNAAQEFFS